MGIRNPLNPEAGSVPVPEDPREIGAAVRAGAITYRIFPYYAWRYGERGVRFTHSDSAWLAGLSRFDPPHIRGQLAWLASVLANRGMPTYLLEVHLRVLDRLLSRAVPDKRGQYARLSAAADELRDARLARLDAGDFEALPGAFAERLGGTPGHLLRGAGRLIVAAVADERGGMSRAVESLLEWLGDAPTLRANDGLRAALAPEHRAALDAGPFDGRWADAVRDLVAEARARPAPGGEAAAGQGTEG